MQVASAGKWHTIEYNHPEVIVVDGTKEIFVNNDYREGAQNSITTFKVSRRAGSTSNFTITGAEGDGCIIKTNDNLTYSICSPITKDNINSNYNTCNIIGNEEIFKSGMEEFNAKAVEIQKQMNSEVAE